MGYDKGNIIEKSNIIFKDTYTPDPNGLHPAMITVAVSDDNKYMYFLTLTSQVSRYYERPQYQDMYHIIKKTPYNMLPKTSLINLKNIYKAENKIENLVAIIQPYEYIKIMKKFKEYQSKDPDEYYNEIKDLI